MIRAFTIPTFNGTVKQKIQACMPGFRLKFGLYIATFMASMGEII